MSNQKKLTVAEYLSKQIDLSSKLQAEIAREVGFDNPNVLTMLKQGKTKIPLNRVGSLAQALGINPRHLMRMVLEEYMPETWNAVEESLGHLLLSPEEEQMVLTYREMRISA
ncbi:MAG: XRE family transcriptional regulator [Betaproteobacteria bacterium]|nr:XRE family transcriptional regulator [Betaproteobacteria bacterium]